jgi:hypothetical protein
MEMPRCSLDAALPVPVVENLQKYRYILEKSRYKRDRSRYKRTRYNDRSRYKRTKMGTVLHIDTNDIYCMFCIDCMIDSIVFIEIEKLTR